MAFFRWCVYFPFFIVFWISKYQVYSFKIRWKCSAFRYLMQLKQSKFKAKESFPRFDLKTWKPLKFYFFIKSHLKITFFLFEVIFLAFRFWVSYTTKNWSKRKFPEISKFSISGIGQNQKLRNLWNFIFLVIVTLRVLFPIAFFILSFC